jgi:nicotinate-nucleotide--dimethylbenzimidazole phosphoribosyltransferase
MNIPPLDTAAAERARQRQDELTKPRGSLGRLESLSIALCGMTGRLDWFPSRPMVFVCAADHGVAAQGVSAYPQQVTAQMVLNFKRGGAAVNALASQMGAALKVVDVGMAGPLPDTTDYTAMRIGQGTRDFTQGEAMTHEQSLHTVTLGQALVRLALSEGANILCLGEMGIGNTTSASAIIAAITGCPVRQVTGRGTGIDDARFEHKIAVIEKALALHAPASEHTLRKVGGFEIGVLASIMLHAAEQRLPVVLDGLITAAAALIAQQADPRVCDYLIASHRSVEIGHKVALDYLGLEPLMDLGLRLGEGTGALLALPLIEAAMRTFQNMATFAEAGVSDHVD